MQTETAEESERGGTGMSSKREAEGREAKTDASSLLTGITTSNKRRIDMGQKSCMNIRCIATPTNDDS
jgi:hypothetical protein